MEERSVIPKTRRNFAKFLMKNDKNILKTLNQLEDYYKLDDERRNTLRSILQRVRDNVKKSKKSIDLLTRDWWNQSLPFEPKKLNQNCASVPISGVTETELFISRRKSLMRSLGNNRDYDWLAF